MYIVVVLGILIRLTILCHLVPFSFGKIYIHHWYPGVSLIGFNPWNQRAYLIHLVYLLD
jgi:hypothetical protein